MRARPVSSRFFIGHSNGNSECSSLESAHLLEAFSEIAQQPRVLRPLVLGPRAFFREALLRRQQSLPQRSKAEFPETSFSWGFREKNALPPQQSQSWEEGPPKTQGFWKTGWLVQSGGQSGHGTTLEPPLGPYILSADWNHSCGFLGSSLAQRTAMFPSPAERGKREASCTP